MGLKNYNEQINLIRQADSQIAYLNSYANSMNALIISLGSLWDDNVDQGYMLNAIGNCVRIASEIAYDYSVFSANSIKWLNNMDNLEKLVRALIPGKNIKIKPFRNDYDTPSVTQRDKIRVNPDDLSDFATQIDGYTKRLEAIHVKTSGLNKQIDNLIISKFASRYSLSSINKRIVKLKNINSNIANALRKISEAYRKTENELKGMVDALEFGADSAGNVNPQVEKTVVTKKGDSASEIEEKTKIDPVVDAVKNQVTPKTETVDNKVLDDPGLYPKQEPKQCTLYANLYLMSRYSIMHGGPAITPETYRNYTDKELWQGGMVDNYNFTVAGETVHVQNCQQNNKYMSDKGVINMNASEKVDYVKKLLVSHPEGVVVYDHDSARAGSGTHAILVTGYDEASGQFLVIDPARGTPSGVIKESQAIVSVANIEAVWVIDSY